VELGLFGGSFDPIHNGHLWTLKAAARELSLDRVLIIPNPVPPHKSAHHLAPYVHRREMVRLALQDYLEFELALLEEESEGPAYTIDTVRKVRTRMNISPENCWLIIGADPLLELENWKDTDALFRDCRLAVLPRPGWDPSHAPKRFLTRARILKTPEVAISASEIRKKISAGEPIDSFVPKAVETYIHHHRLYR
jgi:nicotinate-nucleotide adenylyltransferase